MKKFKPGDRVVIARGPGAGRAGTIVAPAANEPFSKTHVAVIFDEQPYSRYRAPIAGLDHEAIPKKPPRPSVRWPARRRKRG